MARTLDATLATAQDATSRRPIIELLSQQSTPDIPFDGQSLGSSLNSRFSPEFITHSTGIICGVLVDDSAWNKLSYFYTDANHTEWYSVNIVENDTGYENLRCADLCEMANGNLLIIFQDRNYSNEAYSSMIISPTGTVVTSRYKILDLNPSTYTLTNVCVENINGTYFFFYPVKTIATGAWDIYYRTSTNGTTWVAGGALSTGLTNTYRIENAAVQIDSNAKVYLFFDYVTNVGQDGSEERNIYYMTSVDNGANWSSATAFTSNTTVGIDIAHPSAAMRSTGDLEVAYTKFINVLFYQHPEESAGDSVVRVEYNATRNELYMMFYNWYVGTKALKRVRVMDVDTWTVIKTYDYASVPSFNTVFTAYQSFEALALTPKYSVTCTSAGQQSHVAIVDFTNQTIIERHFNDNLTYGVTRNVTPQSSGDNDAQGGNSIEGCYVDDDNDRIWLYMHNGAIGSATYVIGYLDLNDTADAQGYYPWHEVVYRSYPSINGFSSRELMYDCKHTLFVPGDGLIYLNACEVGVWSDTIGAYGWLGRFSETNGGLIDITDHSNLSGFHKNGLYNPFILDGIIWGYTFYTTAENQGDRSGIIRYDPALKTVSYFSSGESISSYGAQWSGDDDHNIFFVGTTDGMWLYRVSENSWEHYDENTVSGLVDGSHMQDFAYDKLTETVWAACPWYSGGDYTVGVFGWNLAGTFEQTWYKTGVLQGDGSYIWGDEARLLLGNQESEASLLVDDDNSLWSFWRRDLTTDPVIWDKEGSSFYLQDHLIAGKDVTVKWSIADPAVLKFTLANGHLYDINNFMSLLSPALRKGRRITLRLGENVSASDYWENQGTYYVSETRVRFQRDEYPVIEVKADDRMAMMKEGRVRASAYYSNSQPETVVAHIITTYDNLSVSDYNLPSLSWTHAIYHQFIDRTIWEMLEELGDHFGFQCFIDMDNIFTWRELDFEKAVDHSYTTNDKLIAFTPDDSYSTFINKVTVTGETRTYIEVTYNYERVGSISGTVGWWGHDKDKTVHYSDDGSVEAVNPYLKINQSVSEFQVFSLRGGGSEAISYMDPYNKYVIIEIEAPNLVGLFIGSCAAMLAIGTAAMLCDEEWICGVYTFALTVIINVICYLLAAVANYDYEIYAQPVGREKQTVQASAEDLEFQNEIGRVVDDFIEDPLCYLQTSCQVVADREIALAMAQRRRVSFEKVAHLQDEVGDMVSIVHPYGGNTLKVLVTELLRRYNQPEPNKDGGAFTDEIEGWRIDF